MRCDHISGAVKISYNLVNGYRYNIALLRIAFYYYFSSSCNSARASMFPELVHEIRGGVDKSESAIQIQ